MTHLLRVALLGEGQEPLAGAADGCQYRMEETETAVVCKRKKIENADTQKGVQGTGEQFTFALYEEKGRPRAGTSGDSDKRRGRKHCVHAVRYSEDLLDADGEAELPIS